jgi:hypothetical protein
VPDVLKVHIHARDRDVMIDIVGYVLPVRLHQMVLPLPWGMLKAKGLLQRPGS